MDFIKSFFLLIFFSNNVISAELTDYEAEIRDILSEIKLEQGYPGISLAISYKGQVVSEQIGYANLSEQIPVDSETIFRAYSLTKGLTQILVQILVSNGDLDINSPIRNYISELPENIGEITSQQLLTHHSGIRHYRSDQEWLTFSQNHCSTAQEALSFFINEPLLSLPGTQEYYSTYGYILLSAVIEAATNRSFEDLIKEFIISPAEVPQIEMDNPGYNITQNVSTYYEPTATQFFEADNVIDGYFVAPSIDNSCKFGGGSINATPTAFTRIYNDYFSGNLTNETSTELTSRLPRRFSLSGEGLGGRSTLVAVPSENLVVVITANSRGGDLQPYAIQISELLLGNKYEL